MITDIPTSDDFESNGLAFLNLAWESVTKLSLAYSELKAESHDDETTESEQQELDEAYWRNSQPAIATAVALAHQGGEFLLKSRIVSISPFLLLYVEKWPAVLDGEDRSFADFRTVDAQELIKIHDNVCPHPLPVTFKTSFESLRKLRNTIMHSVHRQRAFTPRDGVLAILEIADTLMGVKSWQALRCKYQEEQMNIWDPYGYSSLNPLHPYAEQTLHVINEILTPAEAKKFYGFNKRQRKYLCTQCHEPHADDFVWSVQLKPASSASTTAYCVCCQTTFNVKREACKHCPGNVFALDSYEESWICLSCEKGYLNEDAES